MSVRNDDLASVWSCCRSRRGGFVPSPTNPCSDDVHHDGASHECFDDTPVISSFSSLVRLRWDCHFCVRILSYRGRNYVSSSDINCRDTGRICSCHCVLLSRESKRERSTVRRVHVYYDSSNPTATDSGTLIVQLVCDPNDWKILVSHRNQLLHFWIVFRSYHSFGLGRPEWDIPSG